MSTRQLVIFTLITSRALLLHPQRPMSAHLPPDTHYPPGLLRYWLMNRTVLSRRRNQGSWNLGEEVQRVQRAGIPSEVATFFSPLITGCPGSWTKLDRQVLGVSLYQFPLQPCVSSRAPHSVFISWIFIHLCRRPSTFHSPPTYSSPVPSNSFRFDEEKQWALPSCPKNVAHWIRDLVGCYSGIGWNGAAVVKYQLT